MKEGESWKCELRFSSREDGGWSVGRIIIDGSVSSSLLCLISSIKVS